MLGRNSINGSHMVTRTSSKELLEKDCNLKENNENLRERLDKIELLCIQLSNEITLLKAENKELKNGRDSNKTDQMETMAAVAISPEYYTDEEELARETDWIMKKKRPNKKRKAESSLEADQPKPNVNGKLESKKWIKTKEMQPPPINVIGIKEYARLHSLLNSGKIVNHKITILNNNVWNVQIHTEH